MESPGRSSLRTDSRVGGAHLLALLLGCALLLPARLCAVEAAGRWTVVQGRVAVTKAGAGGPRPARPGDAVAVGDFVETGQDGRAQALLADDTVMNLSSGTAVRILQYSFDPASGRRTAVVKISGGKARFVVSGRRNSRFTVESLQAVVAAAAAADFVTLVAPDATTVGALDGSVKVRNLSQLVVSEVDLWSNQTTVVSGGTAPSHPAPIAPQQRKEYRRDAREF